MVPRPRGFCCSSLVRHAHTYLNMCLEPMVHVTTCGNIFWLILKLLNVHIKPEATWRGTSPADLHLAWIRSTTSTRTLRFVFVFELYFRGTDARSVHQKHTKRVLSSVMVWLEHLWSQFVAPILVILASESVDTTISHFNLQAPSSVGHRFTTQQNQNLCRDRISCPLFRLVVWKL